MGTVAGGLASLIGGAGGQAAQVGQQIRGLLEQRRENLAAEMFKLAQDEPNPDRRAEYAQHGADLLANKDLGKVIPGIMKTAQAHVADNAATGQAASGIAQMIGGGEKPSTIPGPSAPGQPIGSGQQPAQPAAQPATSPVQPQTQGGASAPVPMPIPPVGAAPEAQTGTAPIPVSGGAPAPASYLPGLSIGDMQSEIMGMTPAMRAAMLPEISNAAQVRRTAEQSEFYTKKFQQLWNDPNVAPGTEGIIRSNIIGSMMGVPGMGGGSLYGLGSLMTPISTGDVPGTSLPADAKDLFGNPILREPGAMYTLRSSKIPGQPAQYVPITPPTGFELGTDGQFRPISRHLPTGAGGVGGPTGTYGGEYVNPRLITQDSGATAFISPIGAQQGTAPISTGGFNPAMATVSHSNASEPTLSGGTVASSQTSKGFPAVGAPASAKAGTAAKPPAGGGGVWAGVRPFDPSTTVDHLIQEIGQDAANKSLIPTRGPYDPVNNPSKTYVDRRMAQLGIDPNNVSATMRDRAELAQTVLPHFDTVMNLIQQAKADGDMGILMTRWNDLLTGKVGEDPTKGHVFSALSTQLTFLNSAIAMTHGGLRAAASPQVLEKWNAAIHAKDPDTLVSQLQQAHEWIEGYAKMAEGAKKVTPTSGETATPPSAIPPVNGARPPLNQIFQ